MTRSLGDKGHDMLYSRRERDTLLGNDGDDLLTMPSIGSEIFIRIASTGEILAILVQIDGSAIGAEDFP
ncbi:hypothetical protein IQ235_05890 [Oscillatoriales cyanobacterium LEGE 11467]|uniref:Uncharacterized protein n=1 Tax=Zarconia navalis LEGE 11467 TaxID=1828826 RepID=A0A928VW08_9CYAN|nr:hypothetical protein [Zarconia navalis]MBE9040323.1 hypothetical protein [Zarconia navalis LEGE 11467]